MTNNKASSVLFLKNPRIEAIEPPKALAFDLDLTIHNVISHYNHSVNQTLLHFGYKELSNLELKQLGGNNFTSTRDLFAALMPEELLDQAVEYYYNHFLSQEIPPQAVIPGAKELLQLIKKRFQIPIVAITNSEETIARKILEDLNLTKLFDYIVGTKENIAHKPNPQMLLIALEHIKIKPGPHVWFIGDLPTDVQCAKQANCTAIRFYHKIDPQDLEADLSINNHYNLFNIISSKLG